MENSSSQIDTYRHLCLLSFFVFTIKFTFSQLTPLFNPTPSAFNINSNNPVYATNIYYDNIDNSKQAFHIFLPDTIDNYPLVNVVFDSLWGGITFYTITFIMLKYF